MGVLSRHIRRRMSGLTPEIGDVLIGYSLSLDPLPYRRYSTFAARDADALAGDWQVVGNDLRSAMRSAWNERRHRKER